MTSQGFTLAYQIIIIGMLKATFEHVHNTLPAERSTKLEPFQQFVCTMIKLSINIIGYRY